MLKFKLFTQSSKFKREIGLWLKKLTKMLFITSSKGSFVKSKATISCYTKIEIKEIKGVYYSPSDYTYVRGSEESLP